jgi:hypothetical protein
MDTKQQDFGYVQETKASAAQMAHREKLYQLFRDRPMPDEQLLTTLGLYMRSSALAKILFCNEAYQLILNQPGVIFEFGTWWGQNLVLFENLRAIYEPFNQSRRVVGFDTFAGYQTISEQDRPSETIKIGGYTTSAGYDGYLNELIDYHEKNNVLANVKKHRIVKGNVIATVPKFLADAPETIIALAYFDMAVYEPTKACLEAIKPHLVKGSVVMLDELNSSEYPGETVAFKEVFRDVKVSFRRSQFMTDRTFITIE